MRSKLFLPLLGVITIILSSCQKDVNKTDKNEELISKVNTWLTSRKPINKKTQSENVELLRNNLDYSALSIEQTRNNEEILVIPIKDELKQKKNLDARSILNLVLIRDNMGKIQRGNIVVFNPRNGNEYSRVPASTFHDIVNTGTSNTKGKFKYLSVTGKKIYEFEYDDAGLKSFGHFKDSSHNNHGMRTSGCTNWYWVYTLRDEFGNVWYTWEEYYGTTCDTEDCEDPYNAMLCPEDNGGGGGGVGDEYDVEAESVLMSQVFSVTTQPAFSTVSFSSQAPDIQDVPFSWVVVKNVFNLWQVISSDIARGYTGATSGSVIYDIQHQGSALSGITSWTHIPKTPGIPLIPFINISWQETSNQGTIAPNYKSATMRVSGTLKNWGIPLSNHTGSCTVNV